MGQVSRIIGEHICKMRAEKGWTQNELADKAGLGLTTIGKLERGDNGVMLETILKTIDAFKISYSDFFKIVDVEIESLSAPSPAITCYEWLKEQTTDQQERILSIFRILGEVDGFKH